MRIAKLSDKAPLYILVEVQLPTVLLGKLYAFIEI